jgi:ABC-2 type transport system ATP-binding protein
MPLPIDPDSPIMRPMIHTEQLTRSFDGVVAVDSLTLDVHPGEVFGFLGPNGAGKTTTVRLLTCLIAPTSGLAIVNGLSVGRDNGAIRRSVGILTETPGLYDRLTAEHNLRIYAELYEVKDPCRQVERYLRLMGLWERRDEEAGVFSKGMRQKLAIARALLHEPPIVFLDEPTAGLDPEAAHMVRDAIAGLRQQGRTVFLCTHNLDEADRLCDRVAVFKTRLVVVDTPANLRTRLFGRKVVFHLRRTDEAFTAAVRALPCVTDVRATDNKLLLTVSDPDVHNPEIVRVLVAAGADICFIGELRHSLEDVYLQLVKGA